MLRPLDYTSLHDGTAITALVTITSTLHASTYYHDSTIITITATTTITKSIITVLPITGITTPVTVAVAIAVAATVAVPVAATAAAATHTHTHPAMRRGSDPRRVLGSRPPSPRRGPRESCGPCEPLSGRRRPRARARVSENEDVDA